MIEPLTDPAYTVPPPGPPGPFGTLAWLRATVSRFSEGETHARRRSLVEARLRDLDPAALRAAASAAARRQRPAEATTRDAGSPAAATTRDASSPAAATSRAASSPAAATSRAASSPAAVPVVAGDEVPVPYLPVAVLAAATGVAQHDVAAVVADVRVVAAAYHPGTDASGADAALARLLARLPPGEPEAVAQHVALLVQACEPTAALVRGDRLPVPVTRRLDPEGHLVVVDLEGHPFGAGARRCPGERHALALAEGLR